MRDALLSSPDREEALSRAYVSAIAARAGYTIAVQDFDRDGIDLQIKAGGAMLPSLDLQLKATTHLREGADGDFRYALRKRNYDLLRCPTLVPRILLVLALPEDEGDWLSVSEEQLILRRCAYWVSLKNATAVENTTAVTITIPRTNRLDVGELKRLMEMARTGVVG
ncbi:DUF4365 domain-containing protein [Tistrella mobilis]|uniref:DUF4365 domain-containing protein n=1 Tax=Tistrella mobilis TaxID=171437 RepID=A0A162L5L9_9PROT|nr:DUF4365 domain-containing protein [Tistrella mobilis]KYO53443.1 hypothetical protein AUP44_03615 [Tistrella mobilis]